MFYMFTISRYDGVAYKVECRGQEHVLKFKPHLTLQLQSFDIKAIMCRVGWSIMLKMEYIVVERGGKHIFKVDRRFFVNVH